MPNLIYNAIKTPDGTVISSRHRHDYQRYLDKNGKEYMVDGGLDYLRRGGDGSDAIEMSLYDDAPHEVQRTVITWGSYGINGDQPRKINRIADMETSHIEAVLEQCSPMFVIKKCMIEELVMRSKGATDV